MYSEHKQAIAQTFDRAASQYEHYAHLQRQVGHTLITFAQQCCPELLVQTHTRQQTLLDAGAGTGYFSRYWQSRGFTVTALDIAAQMLCLAKQNRSARYYQIGDIEALPYDRPTFDWGFSNLALQWCETLAGSLSQLKRCCTKGVMFTTLLDGSLAELSTSFQQLDGTSRVNTFLTDAQVKLALRQHSYDYQICTHQLHYDTLLPLLRDLNGVGAGYQFGIKGCPLTKSKLAQLETHYRALYGELCVSYTVWYGVLY